MNVQEALKRVEQMGEYEPFVDEYISKSSVLNIISQIDEPQKVMVPKFVAEWIEHCKGRRGTLYFAFTPSRMSRELNEWMALGKNDDIFTRAWLDGYGVEKEKLYTVEIPDPHSYYNYRYLKRNARGVSFSVSDSLEWKERPDSQLTEAEIKQDFEWAWQFAKEVE